MHGQKNINPVVTFNTYRFSTARMVTRTRLSFTFILTLFVLFACRPLLKFRGFSLDCLTLADGTDIFFPKLPQPTTNLHRHYIPKLRRSHL